MTGIIIDHILFTFQPNSILLESVSAENDISDKKDEQAQLN